MISSPGERERSTALSFTGKVIVTAARDAGHGKDWADRSEYAILPEAHGHSAEELESGHAAMDDLSGQETLSLRAGDAEQSITVCSTARMAMLAALDVTAFWSPSHLLCGDCGTILERRKCQHKQYLHCVVGNGLHHESDSRGCFPRGPPRRKKSLVTIAAFSPMSLPANV